MALKKICLILTFCNCMIATLLCFAHDYPYPGQTLQIGTYLSSLVGNPSWVLILRDAESQRVLPYSFKFTDKNHFWVAFTTSRSYVVTVSKLRWGPYAVIDNFCNIENNVVTEQPMFITLKGNLSPNRHSFKCTVQKYNNASFPPGNNEN